MINHYRCASIDIFIIISDKDKPTKHQAHTSILHPIKLKNTDNHKKLKQKKGLQKNSSPT